MSSSTPYQRFLLCQAGQADQEGEGWAANETYQKCIWQGICLMSCPTYPMVMLCTVSSFSWCILTHSGRILSPFHLLLYLLEAEAARGRDSGMGKGRRFCPPVGKGGRLADTGTHGPLPVARPVRVPAAGLAEERLQLLIVLTAQPCPLIEVHCGPTPDGNVGKLVVTDHGRRCSALP